MGFKRRESTGDIHIDLRNIDQWTLVVIIIQWLKFMTVLVCLIILTVQALAPVIKKNWLRI